MFAFKPRIVHVTVSQDNVFLRSSQTIFGIPSNFFEKKNRKGIQLDYTGYFSHLNYISSAVRINYWNNFASVMLHSLFDMSRDCNTSL